MSIGITLDALQKSNVINSDDLFFKTDKNGNAFSVTGSTLISTGLTTATTSGQGAGVIIDGISGTTLKLNSIVGSNGIGVTTDTNANQVIISSSNFSGSYINDNSIPANKLGDSSVSSPNMMGYSGSLLQTQTFQGNVSFSTNTGSFQDVTGAYVTITPKRANSKIIINITTIFGTYKDIGWVTLHKYVGGADGGLLLLPNPGNTAHPNTLGYITNDTSIPSSYVFVDTPQTTQEIKYYISLRSNNNKSTAYVGGYYSWYSSKTYDTYGVAAPTVIIAQEFHA